MAVGCSWDPFFNVLFSPPGSPECGWPVHRWEERVGIQLRLDIPVPGVPGVPGWGQHWQCPESCCACFSLREPYKKPNQWHIRFRTRLGCRLSKLRIPWNGWIWSASDPSIKPSKNNVKHLSNFKIKGKTCRPVKLLWGSLRSWLCQPWEVRQKE